MKELLRFSIGRSSDAVRFRGTDVTPRREVARTGVERRSRKPRKHEISLRLRIPDRPPAGGEDARADQACAPDHGESKPAVIAMKSDREG